MLEDQKKYTTIHYQDYLDLDKVLDAQHPRSAILDKEEAHDELLFIITHQVYELWFKQILHELSSIHDLFNRNRVDERNIGTAVSRINRVVKIQKLLIRQIEILETMTPLDFLDFRNYLFPASGFQSFQFRLVEAMLGLKASERLTYNNKHYASVFPAEKQEKLKEVVRNGTLFDMVEDWLERTPFLQFGEFDFLKYYQVAVDKMIEREQGAIKESVYLDEEEKEMRLGMLKGTDDYFDSVLDPEVHQRMRDEGKLRLSYKATIAALLINLYRDEPILHEPFKLLVGLIEVDEMFTAWRYRHAQMVLRMLGKKIGTGGSSGHKYLHKTAVEHHIFTDLHNISTMLIPRSDLPELPDGLKRELGFYFTESLSETT